LQRLENQAFNLAGLMVSMLQGQNKVAGLKTAILQP
jgi:hypothetical protein